MSEQQSTPIIPNELFQVEFGSTTFEKLQNREAPNVLYHYTDQTGLLGIITSGQLHATKVQYMNDSTEFGPAALRLLHAGFRGYERAAIRAIGREYSTAFREI